VKLVAPTVLAAVGAAVAGLSVAATAAAGGARVPAAPQPADSGAARFEAPVANPWFPLVPGTVSTYRGREGGEQFRERVTVTARTRVIEGVETTVVRDVVRRADGTVAERTTDWYAADDDGNVWYFGERTATFDHDGSLESREGSWRAGVDGAVAGTIMPAHPGPTDAYRQEFHRGGAEDQAWIVQRGVTATVPHGRVHDVVRSFEWSRLEKAVISEKLYAPGLGIVRERDVSGGDETFVLVSVAHR
jgi:hypothetical protein